MMLKPIIFGFVTGFLLPFQLLAQPTIESPDKKIQFNISLLNGKLQYAINFNSNPVIETSPLGIQVNDIFFGENAAIGKITTSKKEETYNYRGIHSKAVNKYNSAAINITSATAPFILEVKVFNDGVAFRYIIDKKDSSVITKETTAFLLPAGSIIWSQPNVKYYEGRYSKKLLDTISAGTLMGPPATIELPDTRAFAAITEGGLTDFGGLSLVANGKRQLGANLSGTTRKYGRIETPWRIIEIGKDLNTLVNCDIVANVSPGYDKKIISAGVSHRLGKNPAAAYGRGWPTQGQLHWRT